jgi:hypothetical protein
MHNIGMPAQRAVFPPAREILPCDREAIVTAIPGHGNVTRRMIPASLSPAPGRDARYRRFR